MLHVCVCSPVISRAREAEKCKRIFLYPLFVQCKRQRKSAKRLIADAWQFNYNERAIPFKVKCKNKGRNQSFWGLDGRVLP